MDTQKKKEKIEQMKKGLNIAQKIAVKTGKVGAKIGKKILKKGAKITVVTARTGYKGAKKAYGAYKKLDKNARRNLHHGVLVAGGVLGLAGTMYMSRYTPENSPEPLLQQTDTRADSIRAALTKTYKITDEASFEALYKASLPLIHISMLPTEIYKESAYDDRGGANPNSIAVGLFWFPEDGDPTNPKWIRASKYLKQHKDLVISYEKALTYTDAWCRYRENGRVYNQLFKKLQGSEITPHQFAACFTTTYNSEGSGFKFCEFVRDNYKNPIKCVHYLLTLDPKDKSCIDGILKRHITEGFMFMYPEYAMQMYSFKMKNISYVNKKGETKHHTITSVNQLSPQICRAVRDNLAKGDTTLLAQTRDRICKYICKGGITIEEFINNHVKDNNVRDQLLCYANVQPGTISFEEVQVGNLYAQALEAYNAGNYEAALSGFQQLRAEGYDGADLRCDIAITQYHLGQFQECIAESRAVLETGEEYLYPRATFNAGKAYEAMENYERAKLNYERSKLMAEKNQANDSLKKIYQEAVNRVDSIIKSKQPKKELPVNIPTPPKKKIAPRAAARPKVTAKATSKAKSNIKTQKTQRRIISGKKGKSR